MVRDEQTVGLAVDQAKTPAARLRVLQVKARPAGGIAPVQCEQEPGVGVGVEVNQGRAAPLAEGAFGATVEDVQP